METKSGNSRKFVHFRSTIFFLALLVGVLTVYVYALHLFKAEIVRHTQDIKSAAARYTELANRYIELETKYNRLVPALEEMNEWHNADQDAIMELCHEVERLEGELAARDAETGAEAERAWTEAGTFTIVHYCPCPICTGHSEGSALYGVTRTGTKAQEGRTVAVDPAEIPLGSEVKIGDTVYIAEDTGVSGRMIDVYVGDHQRAVELGVYTAAVSWRQSG